MAEQEPLPCNLLTMFGLVPEKNTTFCIDTSGSMYLGLEAVKEDLIATLSKRATCYSGSLFNLIEFNSEVTQWADKMVRCTPETVNVAKTWIRDLKPKTGTNTQDALLTALSDPNCDAVYLVTDGLPDQYPEDILDHVGYAGQSRPVHCIYLVTKQLDSAASEFLEDLAAETYGSFHVVTLTNHGCVDKITPILAVDHAQRRVIRTVNGTLHPSSKACSVSTALQVDPEDMLTMQKVWLANNPYLYPYHYPYGYMYPGFPYHYYPQPWSRYRPARGWLKAQDEMLDSFDNIGHSPSAGALLVGKRVLARSNTDGYFYLASVQSQILENKFLIGFGPTKHGKYKDTVYQETWVYDIISYEDAKRHAIITGDKVLAAWEPDGEKFCSGTVIKGHEKREAEGPDEDQKITVVFSNGKTETVPINTAVWIPVSVFERLDLELKMPADVRKSLEDKDNYPQESLPGYPTSGPKAKPTTFKPAPVIDFHYDPVVMHAGLYRYPGNTPPYPIFFKQRKEEIPSAVKSDDLDATIPGTNITQKELQEKIHSQLEEHLGESETEVIYAENEGDRKCKDEEVRKRDKEIHRLRHEIKIREDEIQQINEEAIKEREARDSEADMDGLQKRKMLMEDIRKREKELELLRLEEERGALEMRLEEQRVRQREEKRKAERLRRHRELRSPRERSADDRVLYRGRQGENSLKKSVSFKDELDEYSDRGYDSGHGSSPELWENEEYLDTLPPEYRVLYQRKQSAKGRNIKQKPTWKYWGSDPSPEIGVKTTGLSKPAPFRNTLMQAAPEAKDRSVRTIPAYAPSETQDHKVRSIPVYNTYTRPETSHGVQTLPVYNTYTRPETSHGVRTLPVYNTYSRPETSHGVRTIPVHSAVEVKDHNIRSQPVHSIEWTSPNFRYVDVFAKHNYNNSVGQLMKNTPQPPSHPKPVVFPDSEMGVALGVRERMTPAAEDIRREHRRARVIARQMEFTCRIQEQEQMKEVMEVQHRQRIMGQIQKEKDRQVEQHHAIQRTFEAKQRMNQELQVKLTENSHCANERDQRRLAAKVAKREQREMAWAQKSQEIQEKIERTQEVKVQRSQARWDEVHNKMVEADRATALQEERCRSAKINRIQHFHNREEIAQRNKELRVAVTSQQMEQAKSQVLL